MYLEKQNGHSLLVQAIFFFGVFFPGTGGVVFTILGYSGSWEDICVSGAGPPPPPPQGEAVGILGWRSQSALLWYRIRVSGTVH